MLLFTVWVESVRLTQLLSSFRRLRAARVTGVRMGTVFVPLIHQLVRLLTSQITSRTSCTFIRENFSSRFARLFVTPFNG